jgi:hypothetical protein
MACTCLVDGAVRRRWYPDRWVEFESTARGRVPVPEPMGRIRFDSARRSTGARIDGPSLIGQHYYGYQWSVGGPGLIWLSELVIYRGSSSIGHTEKHRWSITGWVRFVNSRCTDVWPRGEFASGGNTNILVRVRFVNTDVLIMNSASSIRELRCFDDEQYACSIRELECSVAAVFKILWIIADSVDIPADLWQLSTFVCKILWIMDYRHLCAIFFGLSSILCCGSVSLWQSLTIVFDTWNGNMVTL